MSDNTEPNAVPEAVPSELVTDKSTPHPSGFSVTEPYRWYVVWLLFFVYVLNFVDRQILTIVIEPIRAEFGFSDSQLGLLTGLAFAMLYTILGIPIARLADRRSRVNIIAIAAFVWSLATVFTGFAKSFTHILLARIAVGVGEAGCTPPAYSLISDYFDKHRRTTAIAIYTMGIYGGVFIGYLVGALIAEKYGWRMAFFAVGAPGIVLALIVKLTLREPPRGFSEDSDAPKVEMPPIRKVFSTLMAKATFWHLALAAALHAFVGYGVNGFHPAFLMRTHGLSVAETGMILSFVAAISGIGGTWFGGYLTDKLANARDDIRWQMWLPGIATLLNVPTAFLAYSLPGIGPVVGFMFISLIFGVMYLGPTFSTMQRLVTARERALGSALLLFVVNLVGLGLGPYLVGVVSDLLNAMFLAEGYSDTLAKSEGLRWALVIMIFINVWSFIHYMFGAKSLKKDIVA